MFKHVCCRCLQSTYLRPGFANFRTSNVYAISKMHSHPSPISTVVSESVVAINQHSDVSIARNIPFCSGHLQSASLLACRGPMVMQVRGAVQNYYQPSAWKRVNKHGLEKRLMSECGVEILWRRILKKRHVLCSFERILDGTVNGQILPAHHLKNNQHLINAEVRKKVEKTLANLNWIKCKRKTHR